MKDNHLRVGKENVDPLTKTTGEAGRVLFDQLNQQCRNFPYDAVIDAAGNVLLNVIRQRNASRASAERDFDETFGKLKSILMAHYDSVNGRRRSVFPSHQIIQVPPIRFKK